MDYIEVLRALEDMLADELSIVPESEFEQQQKARTAGYILEDIYKAKRIIIYERSKEESHGNNLFER